MNEELTLRLGKMPSLHPSMTTLSKSSALVSSGPIICRPFSGSPTNGTLTEFTSLSSSRKYVAGSTSSENLRRLRTAV